MMLRRIVRRFCGEPSSESRNFCGEFFIRHFTRGLKIPLYVNGRMLVGLSVSAIENRTGRGHASSGRRPGVLHNGNQRVDSFRAALPGQLSNAILILWPTPRVPALAGFKAHGNFPVLSLISGL
jgi:hypothetical protein